MTLATKRCLTLELPMIRLGLKFKRNLKNQMREGSGRVTFILVQVLTVEVILMVIILTYRSNCNCNKDDMIQ